MTPVSLKDWVEQQCREIGFGKTGKGLWIGRDAVKRELIARNSKHEEEIKQLVNAIKPVQLLRQKALAAKPLSNSSQPKDLPLSPATPLQTSSPSKSNKISKCTPTSQSSLAPLHVESKKRATKTSGSGLASGGLRPAKSVSKAALKQSATLAGNAPIHAPSSKAGGPKLKAPPSTSSEANQTAKVFKQVEPIPTALPTPKIQELKKFLEQAEVSGSKQHGKAEYATTILSDQLELLHFESSTDQNEAQLSASGIQNAVLVSNDVLDSIDHGHVPQYGLLGSSELTNKVAASASRLFLNTNIPFSAFVCGVQGSGKSHTTACMVENCLIPTPALGVLHNPLSALVFNFAEYASASSFRPCELAFLACPGQQLRGQLGVTKVNVLVSLSNYLSLKAAYTQIPGVTVQPFKLRSKDLNISTMLTLMSFDQTLSTPLYMATITKILRSMASETAEGFSYTEFRRRLDNAGLARTQEAFLIQRLELLESFLDLDGSTQSPTFAAGEITIIDLSCPFLDSSTACVLFKIAMGLYLEADSSTGKVIVLDEAHKYMTDTHASKALTDSLMGVIRQQRHYGARVIISTQEPRISPTLIDLCSITIMHRFSSPEWLNVLRQHILVSDDTSRVGLLMEIMSLRTGEALVFAPSAVLGTSDEAGGMRVGAGELFRMRMRKRITWDGGRSVVCI